MSSMRTHSLKPCGNESAMVDMTTLLSDLVGHLYRITILTPEMDVFRRMGSTHLVSRHFFKLRVLSTERIAHYSGMRTHAHMHKDTYTCIHKDTCTYA